MAAFVMFSSCGGNTGSKVAQEDSLVIDTVATLEQDTTEDVQAQLTESLQSGDAAQVRLLSRRWQAKCRLPSRAVTSRRQRSMPAR